MAACHGRRQEAHAIFEGLGEVRPESVYPAIGMAVAEMGAGHYEEAVGILRSKALRQNPGSAEVLCFLGLALKLAGRGSESEATLRQATSTGDEQTRSLAQVLLS